jgi:hypothetical protein
MHNLVNFMRNTKSVVADFNKDSHNPFKIATDTLKVMRNLLRIMRDPGKDDAKLLRIMHNPIKVMHNFNEINAKHGNISHDLEIIFLSLVLNSPLQGSSRSGYNYL